MKIIIVGGGLVGFNLAETLCQRKHQVTIIEKNPQLCREIESKLDLYAVVGSGTTPSVLQRADIENAEMIIAVTPHDDTNLICCNFAKQFGVQKRISRIKSSDFTDHQTQINLLEVGVTHIIEPEKEVVNSALQFIELPGATESFHFPSDNVCMRGYRITESMPLANKTLVEVNGLIDPGASMLIVLIIRDGETIMPTGVERLLPGDEIYTIMPTDALSSFKKLINKTDKKIRRVVIFGDSLTAFHLASALENIAEKVVLVDPDNEHGLEVAQHLKSTQILHGDCTEIEILQEVEISKTSFFIAAAKDHEDNLMAGILAKAEGAKEVIAISHNEKHYSLFTKLGIDHIVNPKIITSQKIISTIFRIPIGALLSIKNADIEICRFVAGSKNKIINTPLRNIEELSRKNLIIGSIIHDDQVTIPSGDSIIAENDEVIVICKKKDYRSVEKLFQ